MALLRVTQLLRVWPLLLVACGEPAASTDSGGDASADAVVDSAHSADVGASDVGAAADATGDATYVDAADDGALADVGVSGVDAGDPLCAMTEPAPAVRGSRMCADDWELCFEGERLPGQGLEPHELWDNPIDDAWHTATFRSAEVQIDARGGGRHFLSMRRPEPGMPGWFMRSDSDIDDTTGIEIDLGIRVPATSDDLAVGMLYTDRRSGFAVLFNFDSIVFNSQPNHNPRSAPLASGGSVQRALAGRERGAFMDLRVRKRRSSDDVEMFFVGTDGTLEPVFAEPLVAFPIARPDHVGMQLSVGDPERMRVGHYDLDYMRSRRMGASLPIVRDEPLPRREADDAHFIGGIGRAEFVGNVPGVTTSIDDVISITEAPGSAAARNCGEVSETGAPLVAHRGVLSARGGLLCVLDARFGVDRGHTLEVAFRFVDPASTTPAHVSWLEPGNGYSFGLLPRSLQARTYGKPVGARPIDVSFAPCGRNVVRIVRAPGATYAHVYVNGRTEPAIADYKTGAAPEYADRTAPLMQLLLGAFTAPLDPTSAWRIEGAAPQPSIAAGNIEIDYIRWSDQALAP